MPDVLLPRGVCVLPSCPCRPVRLHVRFCSILITEFVFHRPQAAYVIDAGDIRVRGNPTGETLPGKPYRPLPHSTADCTRESYAGTSALRPNYFRTMPVLRRPLLGVARSSGGGMGVVECIMHYRTYWFANQPLGRGGCEPARHEPARICR